jgi:hypothetical protein
MDETSKLIEEYANGLETPDGQKKNFIGVAIVVV